MRLWVALCISLLLCASSVWSQAVFTETWSGFTANGTGDTIAADNGWGKHGGCYLATDPVGDFVNGIPYDSFAPSVDPCNAADDTAFVTMIVGDDTSNCNNTWDDPAGGTCNDPLGCYARKHRSELIPTIDTIKPDNGEEYWLGWRIWVPSNFPATISQSLVVTQGICSPYDGVDWDLRVHTNGQWRSTQRRTVAGVARNDQVVDIGAIQRGTWTNFVKRWIRKTDASGVAELWMNRGDGNGYVKVVTWTGISSQSTQPACLVKHGMYHGTTIGVSHEGKSYQLIFDDFTVAFGATQFNNVASAKDAGACEAEEIPVVFPATGNNVIDDFNRTENPLDNGVWGTGIVGTIPTQANGTVLVRTGTAAAESYVIAPMESDQEVYTTLPNATNHGTSTFRIFGCLQDTLGTAAVDGYEMRFVGNTTGTDTIGVGELANGVYVQIGADINQELVNNNKIGLRISSGGNLEAYADTGAGFTSLGTRNDGTPLDCSGTRIGIRVNANSHQADNFGGGTPVISNENNLLLNPIIFFD